MRRGDQLRVADILGAVDKIERWSPRRRSDDDLYRAAVLRELGVIGEAAAHLSEGFTRALPEIPWRQVVALRDNLVHEYWDTAWVVIARVIDEDLPNLKSALGAPAPREGERDVEDLLAAAAARPPLSSRRSARVAPEPRGGAGGRPTCGAWMALARTRCILPAGHSPTSHHRSR